MGDFVKLSSKYLLSTCVALVNCFSMCPRLKEEFGSVCVCFFLFLSDHFWQVLYWPGVGWGPD